MISPPNHFIVAIKDLCGAFIKAGKIFSTKGHKESKTNLEIIKQIENGNFKI
tara:strand:+ start:163 stop:318 length:156 start_codon:yes stop_codon:yes gene_type:complete